MSDIKKVGLRVVASEPADCCEGKEDAGIPEAMENLENGDAVDQPELPVAVQRHLGQQLNRLYREIVEEPLPDKFSVLLEELARKENKS